MLGRMFRVLFGFVLACLAAGLTLVLFVYTPLELAGLAANVDGSRLAEAGLLALAAATHTAVFSAPFALVGAVFGEWRRVRSPAYYALVGILIAALGFFVQYRSEAAGDLCAQCLRADGLCCGRRLLALHRTGIGRPAEGVGRGRAGRARCGGAAGQRDGSGRTAQGLSGQTPSATAGDPRSSSPNLLPASLAVFAGGLAQPDCLAQRRDPSAAASALTRAAV